MAQESIKIDRVFNASTALLWKALTDNEKLKQWYFDFEGNFRAEVGHVFEWTANDEDECNEWLHRGEVLEVVENKKLVHSWSFPGYAGEAVLTWELVEQGAEKTLLKMSFDFLEPFDPNEEALHRRNFVAGWNELINTNLANYINQ